MKCRVIFPKFIFLLFLLAGWANSTILQAQVIHEFDVFYKINQADISWDAEHAIDSVFKKLNEPHSIYYVNINGYSDSVGSLASNLKLSELRAENVALYFQKYDFKQERIKYKGLGNFQSGKITGNSKNINYRKVHIEISLHLSPIDFFKDSLEKFEQFQISSEFGGNVKTNSQTELFIPCDAFVDGNGNDVTGTITIMYREFRDTLDFLSRGVGLNSDQQKQFYDCDGMFELQAFSGKIPIYLKPQASIGVIFGLNKRMTLLDLYRYNDSSATWNYIMHLTDQNGKVDPERYSGSGCGGFYSSCESMMGYGYLVFFVDMGLKYSTSEMTISEELKNLNDAQKQIIAPLKKQSDSLFGEMRKRKKEIFDKKVELRKVDTLTYKIERVKLSKHKSVFHVRCDALQYNEILSLSGVNFQTHEQLPDSLFKVEWDYCKLSGGKGNYTINLSVNGNKMKLQNLTMKIVKDDTAKTEIKQVFPNYKKAVKVREKKVEEIQDTLNQMALRFILLNKKYCTVDSMLLVEQSKLYSKNWENFHCFWELNRKYMSPDEAKLSYEAWIAYFDSKKNLMKKRYEKIENTSEYKECFRIDKERNAYYNSIFHVQATEVVKVDTTAPKRDTVIIPLEIPKLGLYSASKPYDYYEKKNDVNKVDYYICKNDTINISCIYILDPKFNSFFEYNGLTQYSPYYLPINFYSIQLIAFDEKGNAYTYLQPAAEKNNYNWRISKSVELLPVKKIKDLEPLFKMHE
jgi:hypothetical protein